MLKLKQTTHCLGTMSIATFGTASILNYRGSNMWGTRIEWNTQHTAFEYWTYPLKALMIGGRLQSGTSEPVKDRDSELLHIHKERKKRTSPSYFTKNLKTDMHIIKIVKWQCWIYNLDTSGNDTMPKIACLPTSDLKQTDQILMRFLHSETQETYSVYTKTQGLFQNYLIVYSNYLIITNYTRPQKKYQGIAASILNWTKSVARTLLQRSTVTNN